MTFLLLRLRSEARDRWRSWLGLAILAGLVGGAVIAALAAAVRTGTAYPRFLEGTNAFHVLVTNGGTTPDNVNRQFNFDEVSRLPQVAEVARVSYYYPSGTAPSGRLLLPSDLTPFASPDGRFGTTLNQVRVLAGRLPQGQNELAVTSLAAETLGVTVGQTLQLQLSGPQAAAQAMSASGVGSPEATEPFLVSGVVAMQTGFPPLTGGLPPPVMLSVAYAQAHPDAAQTLAVRLHRGTSGIADFERELDRLAGSEQVVATNQIEQADAVQRSLAVQASALRLLALSVTIVSLLLLGHAFARVGSAGAHDHGVLRAVGASGAQLRALAVARVLPIGLATAVVAAVTSVGLSRFSPVGVARQAELHPGVELNVAYVGGGAVAAFVVTSLLGAVSGWWTGRLPPETGGVVTGVRRPLRLAAAMAGAGFPAPAVSGVRMGLEQGQGRASVPVRSTIISVALSVATLVVVLVLSSSLDSLFSQPRAYGWNWDVQLGDAFAGDLSDQADRFSREPAVDAVSVGTISRLQIGPLRVDTLAIRSVRGAITPTVVDGRAPSRSDEILLGSRTLHDLGLHVGDAVTVAAGDMTARLTIVGRGVLTEFAGAARLGEGAALSFDGMRRLVPDAVADVVLLELRPGAAGKALLGDVVRAPPGNVYLPKKPSDLADLERVNGLPSIVASLVGVMAVGTLGHTLLTSVQRRRRDLAILKVLGFVRPQVFATVAWQASMVTGIAALIGVPIGLVAGRWAWLGFAERLGVPTRPSVPVAGVALVVLAVIVLANLIAALPARLAAQTRPAAALRAE